MGAPRKQIEAMIACGQAEQAIPKQRRVLTGTEDVLWIADHNGNVLAMLIYFDLGEGRTWLDIVYVVPGARRRGYAGSLLQRLKALQHEAGQRSILFGTGLDNIAMQSLGRREGFAERCIEFECHLNASRP